MSEAEDFIRSRGYHVLRGTAPHAGMYTQGFTLDGIELNATKVDVTVAAGELTSVTITLDAVVVVLDDRSLEDTVAAMRADEERFAKARAERLAAG